MLLIFLWTVSAAAGPWEALSKASYDLHDALGVFGITDGRETCAPYRAKRAQAALNKTMYGCAENYRGLARNTAELLPIQEQVRGNVEDEFFASLAQQHSWELSCASQLAAKISIDETAVDPRLLDRVQLLREFKQALIKATDNVMKNFNVSLKVCPNSLEDLDADFPISVRAEDPSYQACREVIAARVSYDAVLTSLPLAPTPAIFDFLDKYATAPTEISTKELGRQLSEAYKKGSGELAKMSKDMATTVKEKGGAGFDRYERYSLLSNSRVIDRVIERGGADRDLKGVACEASARYGQGADDARVPLFFASWGLALLSRNPDKVGSVMGQIFTKINAARMAGWISANSARILNVAAFGVASATAIETVKQTCNQMGKPVRFDTDMADSTGRCMEFPIFDRMDEDLCPLAVGLSVVNIGATGMTSRAARWIRQSLRIYKGATLKPPETSPRLPFRFKNRE